MRLPREFSIPGIQELISSPNKNDINCHKAVLYVAGKILLSEATRSSKEDQQKGLDFTFGKKAKAISTKEFIPISNSDQLYALAELECDEDVLAVGQILDSNEEEMAHSFLIMKKGGDFVCFDKSGFQEPFRVYHLGELMKAPNYRNQLWRFVPISEVQ